ncbi:MAG: PD-(D/E)XK nuclease family protein [Minisyncoccia bacterium]
MPKKKHAYPIKHWSHSSLTAFLRNPLAWYKRYVELVFDTPRNPSAAVGSAGHKALEHFYSGMEKEAAIALGLEYLRSVPDFEIEFGKAKSKAAHRAKRAAMEREYLQAIGFYLHKPPRHKVLGVEVRGTATVEGFPLPLKAVSDLVVESRAHKGAVDIVDHKFVQSFTKNAAAKTLFVIQALFNYYVVRELFDRPVARFVVYECKKTKNTDGSAQLRRYVFDYKTLGNEFAVFNRLINDATTEIARARIYLPNPSDLFEGENSFEVYRLALIPAQEGVVEDEMD